MASTDFYRTIGTGPLEVDTGPRDYSLTGTSAGRAVELGLAAAEWYHTDLPRKRMRELMQRRDGPAIRNTLLWFALLVLCGAGGAWFWGTWICVPFFIVYGVLYGSAADARWHETGHRTAFKTSWLNETLYTIASFLTLREGTFWRWSHARHHSDTLIVGRDREIIAMRPADVPRLLLNFVGIPEALNYFSTIARHALGRVSAEEVDLVPESGRRSMVVEARIHVLLYALMVASSIWLKTLLPLMLVGLPSLYGRWLAYAFGLMQHAGMAENVLDHRLNSRTVYMNPALRFVFWNMNYHVEHHMFPAVPFHALPELHREVRHDMPDPCISFGAAWREILPAISRQLRDPEYFITKELPPTAKPFRAEFHHADLLTSE